MSEYHHFQNEYDNPKEDPEYEHNHRQHRLYKDKFVELDERQVHIHKYFFPAGTKHIRYTDIQSVASDTELGLSIIYYKGWGMSKVRPLWWALDLSRIIGLVKHENVLITVYNDVIQKAFSVKDAPTVIRIIKERMELARQSDKS